MFKFVSAVTLLALAFSAEPAGADMEGGLLPPGPPLKVEDYFYYFERLRDEARSTMSRELMWLQRKVHSDYFSLPAASKLEVIDFAIAKIHQSRGVARQALVEEYFFLTLPDTRIPEVFIARLVATGSERNRYVQWNSLRFGYRVDYGQALAPYVRHFLDLEPSRAQVRLLISTFQRAHPGSDELIQRLRLESAARCRDLLSEPI